MRADVVVSDGGTVADRDVESLSEGEKDGNGVEVPDLESGGLMLLLTEALSDSEGDGEAVYEGALLGLPSVDEVLLLFVMVRRSH